MVVERWFPRQFELPNGPRLGRLLHEGPDWQIFHVDRKNKVLIAHDALATRWTSSTLIPDTVLERFSYLDDDYAVLQSGAGLQLAPVFNCESPQNKSDGLAFALSLSETRKIDTVAPLHDAIYVERYSRLLPTWSLSEAVGDEEVFGSWLTNGVAIPVSSFRRLSSLLGWMPKSDVRALVEAAGFSVPRRLGVVEGERLANGEAAGKQANDMVQHGKVESGQAPQGFELSGRPLLETFFNEHVIDIIQNADRYKALGIDFPTAIVLHGPPGCGKTFAVERLVEYLDWPMFQVDSNSVGSPYIHETSRKVGEVFDKAMDAAPSLVVIDEMESYLSDRQIHQSSGLHHVEEVAEFLRRIPEANKRCVLVIGMTNRLDMIDSAILRRGRFDHVIEVSMPSADEVRELISALVKKVPCKAELYTDDLVEALTGRPLSDSAFVMREAARLAAREGKKAVDNASLQSALATLPPTKAKKQRIGFIQD